jgi:hypothetical protein
MKARAWLLAAAACAACNSASGPKDAAVDQGGDGQAAGSGGGRDAGDANGDGAAGAAGAAGTGAPTCASNGEACSSTMPCCAGMICAGGRSGT